MGMTAGNISDWTFIKMQDKRLIGWRVWETQLLFIHILLNPQSQNSMVCISSTFLIWTKFAGLICNYESMNIKKENSLELSSIMTLIPFNTRNCKTWHVPSGFFPLGKDCWIWPDPEINIEYWVFGYTLAEIMVWLIEVHKLWLQDIMIPWVSFRSLMAES